MGPMAVISYISSLGWLIQVQLRQGWRMLLATGGLMLCVTTIVCAIPLFSTLALQASLRTTFANRADPYTQTLQIGADTVLPSGKQIDDVEAGITSDVEQTFDPLAKAAPELSVASHPYALYFTLNAAQSQADPVAVRFLSAPDPVMRRHVTLIHGSWPSQQPSGAPLQIVLSQATATAWRVTIGAEVYLSLPVAQPANQVTPAAPTILPVVVVGLATAHAKDPTLGDEFMAPGVVGQNPLYSAMSDFAATLALGASDSASASSSGSSLSENTSYSYYWTYQLNTGRLQPARVAALLNNAAALTAQLAASANYFTDITGLYVSQDTFLTYLEAWQFRTALFQSPIITLIAELLACIVFFVFVLGEYVVAWQSDLLTTLRSRGLGTSYIVWSVGFQALLLGTITLPLGLLSAAALTMRAGDAIITGVVVPNSLPALFAFAWSVAIYAATSVGVMVCAIFLATARVSRLQFLAARREQARESHQPFWLRIYLDGVLIILGGVGAIAYQQVSQSLDSATLHTNTALFAFTVLGPLLLVIGVWLLFSRLSPLFLRMCERLVNQYPGAIPTLAFAHLARVPRETAKLILLLTMAITLSSLTAVTLASQQQYAADIATLNVGTDFQGTALNLPTTSVTGLERVYRAAPGVMSASAGTSFLVNNADRGAGPSITIDMLAMDTTTFGATAYWPQEDPHISVPSLMRALQSQRSEARQGGAVPVIVDAETWTVLGLSTGSEFSVQLPGYTSSALHCKVVGEAPYLPSVQPSIGAGVDHAGAIGGILADYQTVKAVYTHDIPTNAMRPDTIWLRTQQTPRALSAARASLTSGPLMLSQLLDRSALIRQYQNDPIQNDLVFAQRLVASAVVILVLLLTLYDVWFMAQRQQRDSAFLHAFGTSAWQLRMMRVCERTFILIMSVALGLGSAALLTSLLEPVLAFTQLISGDGAANITAFDIPPVRIVVPYGWLAIALSVVIAAIWVGSVYFSGHHARNALGEALRLNQD